MARTATYLHAIVQPGGRIELAAPAGVRVGERLDVVLLTDDHSADDVRRESVLDILDSLPRDFGHFKSADDVDAYVRGERGSWER
jgi:hypothetical protein